MHLTFDFYCRASHMYVSVVAAGGAIVHEGNEDGECLLIIMTTSDL